MECLDKIVGVYLPAPKKMGTQQGQKKKRRHNRLDQKIKGTQQVKITPNLAITEERDFSKKKIEGKTLENYIPKNIIPNNAIARNIISGIIYNVQLVFSISRNTFKKIN